MLSRPSAVSRATRPSESGFRKSRLPASASTAAVDGSGRGFDHSGAASAPAADGRTLVEMDISGDATATAIVATMDTVLGALTDLTTSPVTDTLTMTNDNVGTCLETTGTDDTNIVITQTVAGADHVATSHDGRNWVYRGVYYGTASFAWEVDYNGKLWIGTGQLGVGMTYSFDGITWAALPDSPYTSAFAIKWIGGTDAKWFVGGSGGAGTALAYSYDGFTWTKPTTGTMQQIRGIDSNGSTIVAVGLNASNHSVAYSTDRGLTWTQPAVVMFEIVGDSVVWGSDKFVAVGQSGANGTTIAYSSDGITWTQLTDISTPASPFSTSSFDVDWNGEIFVAGGNTNQIAWSYNGIDWNGLGSPIGTVGYQVEWDGSRWIAINDTGVYSSVDGKVWDITFSNPFGAPALGLAYGSKSLHEVYFPSGRICLAGISGSDKISYSDNDGKAWTTASNGNTVFLNTTRDVQYGGPGCGVWVAASELSGGSGNTLGWSLDGDTWVGSGKTIFTTRGYKLLYVSRLRMWLAGGEGGNTLARSSDGKTWIGMGTVGGISSTILALVDNGKIIIAGGNGGIGLAYSYDGLIWTACTATAIITQDVIWTGRMFLAGGSAGGISVTRYSSDGITWSDGVETFGGSAQITSLSINTEKTMIVCAVLTPASETNRLWYSKDGLNWTTTGFTPPNTNRGFIFWTGERFLSQFNFSSNLYESIDGKNWSLHGSISNQSYAMGKSDPEVGIPYIQHPIVLGCNVQSSGENTLLYSKDGYQWEGLGKSIFTGFCRDVEYGGFDDKAIWLAGGLGGNSIAYSKNGKNWTAVPGSTSIFSSYGVCPRFGRFIDTKAASGISNIWVMSGSGTNTLAYSLNGIKWIGLGQNGTTAPSTVGWQVAFGSGGGASTGGGRFVAVGQSSGTPSVFYSDSGKLFTASGSLTTIIGTNALGVAYGGDSVWVVVGDKHATSSTAIAYSTDGALTWTAATGISFDAQVSDIAWNGKLFVACGTLSAKIIYSTDGKSWNAASFSGGTPTSHPRGVAWTGKMWITSGGSGTPSTHGIRTSSDGINWSSVIPGGTFDELGCNYAMRFGTVDRSNPSGLIPRTFLDDTLRITGPDSHHITSTDASITARIEYLSP